MVAVPINFRLVGPEIRYIVEDAGASALIVQDALVREIETIREELEVPFKNYILDFVCFERKLVVEVDGGQHSDSLADRTRNELLRAEGFQVARYWNNDVLQNPEGVLSDLLDRLARS